MLLSEIKNKANKIAIITDDDIIVSYDEINSFAETINKIIKQRCLVFCLLQNTIGSLCGYVSFISNSIVPAMLDSNIASGFLEELIKTYKPTYLWLPDNRVNEFANYEVVFSKYNYSLVKLEGKNIFALHPDLAMLLTTSGSTGSLKFVRISYENVKANAESISAYLSIDEHERPITTLPMCYSFGLSIINSHILKGATILLTQKTLFEKDFWTFLKNQKASSLSGVTYTFQMLKKLKLSQMDLPSLKTLTQAGGRLHDDLNKEISEYAMNGGKQFFVMYGQTEATARMSYLPAHHSISKLGSIGVAIPGGEFSLIDDKGNLIDEPNIVGELVYKGKNVSMGYAIFGGDLKKGDENNGVLFTGDLAKKDADGFYYIVGRKTRFIKIYGNRVNLDETESLLAKTIYECACTGQDDNMVIYITDKTRLIEIQNYVATKTGIHKTAFSVRYCEEIPKNAAGKIVYSRLETI
jgi:long-chain acyl-CoA synthetase